jgi:predicted DsbA family dithiol-disulfide isomerase
VRIDRLLTEYDIDIRWTAFPLNPAVPPEGYPLADYYASRNLDMAQRVEHMRKVADQLGLPLGKRERIYNSRLAQELGKWAEKNELGEEFHRAVFKAYFAENKNIAEAATLEDIGEQVGLDKTQIRKVISARTFRTEVDEDWQRARRLGINAVPTFVLNESHLVGAQPYDKLKQFVDYHQVPRRMNG